VSAGKPTLAKVKCKPFVNIETCLFLQVCAELMFTKISKYIFIYLSFLLWRHDFLGWNYL